MLPAHMRGILLPSRAKVPICGGVARFARRGGHCGHCTPPPDGLTTSTPRPGTTHATRRAGPGVGAPLQWRGTYSATRRRPSSPLRRGGRSPGWSLWTLYPTPRRAPHDTPRPVGGGHYLHSILFTLHTNKKRGGAPFFIPYCRRIRNMLCRYNLSLMGRQCSCSCCHRTRRR